MSGPDISRRQFFRLGPLGVVREDKPADTPPPPPPIRPPGALVESEFLAKCDRACTECATACPHDAIRALGPAFGDAEGTPFLEPALNPCRWCDPMPCIEACPTGALVTVEGEKVAPIATIQLDLDKCLVRQGTLCTDCSDYCPVTVRAMTSRGREPSLDASKCVGCGLCAWHCEAPDGPIKVVPVSGKTPS